MGLKLKPGTVNLFVGESGSYKTTVAILESLYMDMLIHIDIEGSGSAKRYFDITKRYYNTLVMVKNQYLYKDIFDTIYHIKNNYSNTDKKIMILIDTIDMMVTTTDQTPPDYSVLIDWDEATKIMYDINNLIKNTNITVVFINHTCRMIEIGDGKALRSPIDKLLYEYDDLTVTRNNLPIDIFDNIFIFINVPMNSGSPILHVENAKVRLDDYRRTVSMYAKDKLTFEGSAVDEYIVKGGFSPNYIKYSTGIPAIDDVLDGGLTNNSINTIYFDYSCSSEYPRLISKISRIINKTQRYKHAEKIHLYGKDHLKLRDVINIIKDITKDYMPYDKVSYDGLMLYEPKLLVLNVIPGNGLIPNRAVMSELTGLMDSFNIIILFVTIGTTVTEAVKMNDDPEKLKYISMSNRIPNIALYLSDSVVMINKSNDYPNITTAKCIKSRVSESGKETKLIYKY